jgi:threonyl-tRNA synthetase
MRDRLADEDYVEVRTPQLIDRSLWEKSGHWENYAPNMFIAKSEERVLAVKPMNCPGHVLIYRQIRLPRFPGMAEFVRATATSLQRAARALRVRAFTRTTRTYSPKTRSPGRWPSRPLSVYADFGHGVRSSQLSPARR